MSVPFVHLKVHSEFSLVDGTIRLKPLMKKLASYKMPAVALTDQSNMCALVKFYNGAMGAGIKPIIGVDLWLRNLDEDDNPSRITLYARNDVGYRNITELVSRGFTEGQRYDKAIIDKEWIEDASEGVIALSGAKIGEIGRALLSGKKELAKERLRYWMSVFPDSFYLELQRTGRVNDEECLHLSVELATEMGCPVVATNDVHFMETEDFEAHETRVCIHDSCTIDDPRRNKFYSPEQYLKSPEEMAELFSDIPEALENTLEIAKRCNVEVQLGEYFLPNYPIPEGMTMDEFFRKISQEGLEERLETILDKNADDYQDRRQPYLDRLKFELDIIIQMGFPGYFLIVMDFIQWSKNNDIPVGPGRGSGAGSLVAYVLKITDLDPLQYDLLFERFLNPERVSMPDFDIDFCMDGRDRVIAYVADNYGRNAVSQIITFGTMAAKAVVRDVARVQGKSYGLADRLSKMIPFEIGMTLAKAVDMEAPLREFIEQDEDAQEIWEMALKLEGITRNTGKHAGGVVIAPTKLTDFSPLHCDEEGDGLVTQFDKNDVESAGLVKFDFLGLRTLTIVDWALKMINARKMAHDPVNIDRIPLDDPPSFALLKRAETTAVFQLESRGMKDLVNRLQPDDLEDMIALVALFRPGPLESGMVDDFIARKHGKADVAYPHVDFQHECLKPILEPTYGVIVYQEQVMQIAQALAGYTLGGADMLRRAMGKKKPEEMEKQRAIFAEGAKGQGIDPDLAMKIFDLVEKFAGYGFNKSHSAAYALVSYQTLWLKTHYPAEFMAAVLTADMQNTDKVVILVEECRRMGLDLVLPDVNVSEYTFTVDENDRVVYGLGAIKGLGEGPIESLIEARQAGGPFTSLFDFCDRVDMKKVNKRALEALIKSGAMDNIGPSRGRLMASIGEAGRRADQNSRNQSAGMDDMFGEVISDEAEDVYAETKNIREWSEKERLKLEKDTLGLYLTGHPFDEYEKEVRQFAKTPIADIQPGKGNINIAGLIVAVRTMKNKKGNTMAFVTIDDRTARTEIAFFSDSYEQNKDLLVSDTILVVEGEVSIDDYTGSTKMRVNAAYDILSARMRHAKSLYLKVDEGVFVNGFLNELEETLTPYKGEGCKVTVDYHRSDARSMIELGRDWQVKPADELIQGLRYVLGDTNVKMRYRD
ncbi:DNA polymerase III subunit alpha [Alkalimarinus alittae]|uniref:DNA polymerase III subunit alpha n=1 Tax=Alkalimarinus alittae TaxID=2961619 RepID=A0ABY6N5F7_9ALTE|nr:DNA polymerase III subunit alpha [Alkalimarinus alittae]UZE97355.1 DNA polymerase III subunit alpha [Alkalimarinus alittae]